MRDGSEATDVARLRGTIEWMARAPLDELTDDDALADRIGRAGLFRDDRAEAIYGRDSRYMLPGKVELSR